MYPESRLLLLKQHSATHLSKKINAFIEKINLRLKFINLPLDKAMKLCYDTRR